MRNRTMKTVLVLGGVALLAACGYNKQERASGGAATEAGTGAAIGLVGGPIGVAAGAGIGAAAGAATGASTTPRQLNLGRTPWNNPNASVAGQHP